MRPIHAALAALTLSASLPACAQETDDSAAEAEMDAADAGEAEAITATGPDAATLGEADAPVTIVEYASTTCPHCANFHATLFPHVKSEWIDTGRAKLVMRPLPTAPAELAAAGFLLARCAGDDRYFDVLDDLFETQDALFAALQDGELQTYFEDVAGENGIEAGQIEACMSDESGFEQINASIAAAQEDDVAGTPSFVIDGALYSAGDLPSEAAWDEALQTAYDARQ